jgi:uncharacterized membrane-anchored protein
MRKVLMVLTALLILVAVNFNIYKREQLLSNGRVVLMELAPVDPRSLLQGDYMALRFKVTTQAFNHNNLKTLEDGCLVVVLDERNIASFKRFEDSSKLADNEALLRYRIRNGQSKFATNAFFFQEGHGNDYENARFGKFRVSPGGDAILTQLLDQNLLVLGTEASLN